MIVLVRGRRPPSGALPLWFCGLASQASHRAAKAAPASSLQALRPEGRSAQVCGGPLSHIQAAGRCAYRLLPKGQVSAGAVTRKWRN